MDSNFEVIKSIYENECQRIVECKEIKTGDNYIYNIIYNTRLMKLIDVNTLNSINSNIVKCQKTLDRLYIVTKYHELNNQKLLKDYIDSNNLTLKQQFSLTEQLINLFIQIYNTTDLLQYKILSFDNLSVDEENILYVNGYFEFKDEYDLSDNYSYKNIGKMIHYIFSKEEIVDYNISDTIPPDVLKIIVKCLTREYFHPKDTLKELENSPIYGLINCKTEPCLLDKKAYENEDYEELKNKAKTAIKNDDKVEEPNHTSKLAQSRVLSSISSDVIEDELLDDELYEDIDTSDLDNFDESEMDDLEDSSLDDNDDISYDDVDLHNKDIADEYSDLDDLSYEDDESNVIDIFLSDASNDKVEEEGKGKKSSSIMKIIIPTVIIVFVLIVGFLVIKSLFGNSEPASGNPIDQGNNVGNVDNNKPDNNNGKVEETPSDNNPVVKPDDNDFKLYFNDELIKKIGYTGKIATVSTDVYSTGTSSLLVENDSTETERILFSVIDFTNEKLSYMLNDTVVISAKFKSSKDLDAKLVVEVYKDNKIVTNASAKISIQDDIWIKKDISVGTEKIDRVNLYLEFTGKNKVWIDNISVDIMK